MTKLEELIKLRIEIKQEIKEIQKKLRRVTNHIAQIQFRNKNK